MIDRNPTEHPGEATLWQAMLIGAAIGALTVALGLGLYVLTGG